ncbi:helitron_like_N domain-containing protein [Trichonephila clavipes]|nr:helitron_like_N domain-containing protein [Trichonephila clavipes]
MKRLRALETVQEQETRKSNCLQMMQGRISESAEDHEERPECQRNVTHPSKMAIWNDKENAAYSYNPSIDYKSDASCSLGPMSITCKFCSAMKFKVAVGEHSRRFNESTTPEVAFSKAGDQHGKSDFIPEKINSSIQKIADTHRSHDVLQYPLMFWQVEDGYHFQLRQRNPSIGAFTERKDAVVSEGNVCDVGQLIILPSSFTGSPRYMHERTQGAMNNVQNYGDSDLFITFTCNPT